MLSSCEASSSEEHRPSSSGSSGARAVAPRAGAGRRSRPASYRPLPRPGSSACTRRSSTRLRGHLGLLRHQPDLFATHGEVQARPATLNSVGLTVSLTLAERGSPRCANAWIHVNRSRSPADLLSQMGAAYDEQSILGWERKRDGLRYMWSAVTSRDVATED